MRTEYKQWMLVHVVALAIYSVSLIVFSVLGYKNNYPINILLFAQAITSIVLWLLINKRLFVPAFYLAWIIVILSTYNFYTYMTQDISFLPSYVNEYFKYFVYIGVILYVLFVHAFLVYYPKKVMKTARKLKLTNT